MIHHAIAKYVTDIEIGFIMNLLKYFIEASGSYIEVPAIPTVRSASGLVQSDYNNKITYNEALLNFGTYAYYVVMQVYIFSATYDAALFWLPIRILDNSNSKWMQ